MKGRASQSAWLVPRRGVFVGDTGVFKSADSEEITANRFCRDALLLRSRILCEDGTSFAQNLRPRSAEKSSFLKIK